MSFGEGNLREKVADLNRQVDSYRRQLGGMTAAKNRLKDENNRLYRENIELRVLVENMLKEIEFLKDDVLCYGYIKRRCGELGIGVDR